jgi:hypothetical protein
MSGRTRVASPRVVLAVFVVSLLGAGCARVKPWQREDLARRTMTADQEPGESRFDEHQRASREGGAGGSGQAGGGCGCN